MQFFVMQGTNQSTTNQSIGLLAASPHTFH
jgi:hypothetical protein